MGLFALIHLQPRVCVCPLVDQSSPMGAMFFMILQLLGISDEIDRLRHIDVDEGGIYRRCEAANSLVDPVRMPIAGSPILERFQFGKSFPGHRTPARKEHLCLNKSPTLRPKLLARV